MKDILEFIIKSITANPQDVVIEETEEDGTTNYIVNANPEDIGRIIGKEGKIIKSIRAIMRVIAIQRNLRVRVSVVSENDNQRVEEQAEPLASEPMIPATDEGLTVEV